MIIKERKKERNKTKKTNRCVPLPIVDVTRPLRLVTDNERFIEHQLTLASYTLAASSSLEPMVIDRLPHMIGGTFIEFVNSRTARELRLPPVRNRAFIVIDSSTLTVYVAVRGSENIDHLFFNCQAEAETFALCPPDSTTPRGPIGPPGPSEPCFPWSVHKGFARLAEDVYVALTTPAWDGIDVSIITLRAVISDLLQNPQRRTTGDQRVKLRFVGHSLGAAVAALLTARHSQIALREPLYAGDGQSLVQVSGIGFATPAFRFVPHVVQKSVGTSLLQFRFLN